ncbi:hypothetical protein BDZ89DRAFT_1144543 [Hymenopellis radicata]|nr:hypothetical protein BDZ89DRAFT_1144543 [Hymenopellis radicata]
MQEAYLRYFALQYPGDASTEKLLQKMTTYGIGYRLMYDVGEYRQWTPEVRELTGLDRHFSGKSSSARVIPCAWSRGGREMADDWFLKAGTIIRSPHGARAMIERGGNLARIALLTAPELVHLIFQGPSINVTRHVSGYVDSRADSELVLIGDDLTNEEEIVLWGRMDVVRNDKDCDHLRFIWPPSVWSYTCDQVFRQIWRELEQPHDAISRTPSQFGAMFRAYYRNSDDRQRYAPRRTDILRGINIVQDGWTTSWRKIKLSALDLPLELCADAD